MVAQTKKDLVCGMNVDLPAKYASHWNGEDYAFCSLGCKSKFDADPLKFTGNHDHIQQMPANEKLDFTPLFVIVIGIVVLAAVKYVVMDESGIRDAMYDFMGIFFMVFGGFKLLDVKGFADAYATYDILARKSRTYGLIYPFIELGLGSTYLLRWNLHIADWVTLIIMSIGSIGVLKAIRSKRKIQCACLGTKIKLPMTKVTLIEDVLMAGMALWMLIVYQ